ncbi:MAG: isochorismate synthase [Sporichthyaceae bacterium]
MTTATWLEPLVVRTVELPSSDPRATSELIDLLPAGSPLSWIHNGEGLIGWGAAAQLTLSGPDRFTRAAQWWRDLRLGAAVDDEVGLPGTGPVIFASFAFADGPTPSVLVLPEVVLGRREGRTWLTVVGSAQPESPRPGPAPAPPGPVSIADGALSGEAWRQAVAGAVERIRAGELSKVVLARDLIATAQADVDTRHLIRGLAARYPSCFTFAVQGLVGATPELLIRRHGNQVTSRVLAGTAWDTTAAVAAARLAESGKDHEEHAYAVHSAADALRPYCAELDVPAQPSILTLANVVHLASEVTGTLRTPLDALSLAGLLHPTAAVCGTPSDSAAKVIADLEGMDRGRYAGPVGWMDARGDGEWGIALRCAEVMGPQVRLFAGCGIVAGSDPEAEFAEATAKFLAVREVLEG